MLHTGHDMCLHSSICVRKDTQQMLSIFLKKRACRMLHVTCCMWDASRSVTWRLQYCG
jgi:hypothetical protein